MAVKFNRKTGNYELRIKHYGKEYKKVLGPDRHKALKVNAAVKQDIKEKRLSKQDWTGAEWFKKAPGKPRTFADEAQAYLDERANYKASSLTSYRSILNGYLLPSFGDVPIKDLTSSRLRKYQSVLSAHKTSGGQTLSPSRVNTIMQLLRSILKQAENEGAIDRDPSKGVRRLQEAKSKIDPLDDGELDLALSCVSKHFQPFFIAQAFTGARPNELQALRWSDIDWKKKQISITKGRVRGSEGLPKTAAGDRLIPLLPPVERSLLALLQARQESELVRFKEDDYVFTNKAGNPIDKHLDEVWRRALRKAGLRHRPSYQLRHTFVTRCIIQNMPLPYIAKLIGHSTIDTLVRHYAGWIDAATSQYEQKLRSTFEPAQEKLHRLA
jgi:integrase